MDAGGFVKVDDLLSSADFRNYTEDDIKRVVEHNVKKRFTLRVFAETGRMEIRANQGHSLEVQDLELAEVTNADNIVTGIHGTYGRNWESIKEKGLSKMSRNHIHLAVGEPGENGVISGMRQSCDILIVVDIKKALLDGLKFYKSTNNVILCPGDSNGYLSPKYFKEVLDRKSRKPLDVNS